MDCRTWGKQKGSPSGGLGFRACACARDSLKRTMCPTYGPHARRLGRGACRYMSRRCAAFKPIFHLIVHPLFNLLRHYWRNRPECEILNSGIAGTPAQAIQAQGHNKINPPVVFVSCGALLLCNGPRFLLEDTSNRPQYEIGTYLKPTVHNPFM